MPAEKKLYDLTHHQKGMWYTEKVYPNTSVGVVAGTFRMIGYTDYDVLGKAINAFVRDNDAMRCRIAEDKGEVLQYFVDYEPFTVDFVDFSHRDIKEFYNWEREQTVIPMGITDGPLFSFVMVKISENDGGYYVKMHHLISDAWSITLLANSIAQKYLEIIDGEDKIEKTPSYAEYITLAKEYEKSEKYKKDSDFWMSKYDSAPEVTTLKPRTSKDLSIKANRKTFVLPEKLCQKMYAYSKENRVSIFSMYMSAISMYMYRYTGKEKLNLGTIILNRGNRKEKDTIGMFVATVPVVLDINGNDNFDDFSKKVTSEMFSVMRHQSYPFGTLQEELRKRYNFDDVLYDIILSYQNAKFLNKDTNINYKTRWHFCGYQSNSLTIHINDRENEGRLILDYDYIEELFFDKEIEFLHEHITRLLWHALDNPSKELAKLDMVSETEKQKILYNFNNTKAEYPSRKVVHEIIEETAKRLPGKTAIVFEDKMITYDELNKKANVVAHKLRELGVTPNNIVGLLSNRSIDMMIGLLGIMKSGAAYLPIDPEYPSERIEYMLKNSKTKILLVQNKLKDSIDAADVTKLILEKDFNEENEENPKIINSPEDLIYVIYTSGSTGKPKGVMLKHNNVNNLIKGASDVIDFNENKVIVSVTTICFDIFVAESWLALQKGLTIVLANEQEQNLANMFNELCIKNNVNIINTTPSRINLLIDNTKYLEYVKNITDVIVSGEAFPLILLKKLQQISSANIYNMYGPTETTVWSTGQDLTKMGKINIGKPIANTDAYILDKTLNLCPIGMLGELYIGGEGVAAGYLNNPDLTKQKFILNPITKEGKIYKTGDLVRWMSNGEIIHFGRSDFQVKLRGFRVELEDIKNNILENNLIKDVAIRFFENKYIVVYLTSEIALDLNQIKKDLIAKLPQYMIPCQFIQMESLPYTPNGKVNINLLPTPDFSNTSHKFVPPSTQTEQLLAAGFSNALDQGQISIEDNFFEMGADSLTFLKIQTSLFQYNFDLKTQNFYEYQNIKDLANYIDTQGGKNE